MFLAEQSQDDHIRVNQELFKERAVGFWTKAAIISWMVNNQF